jgi:hypothetical protein
LQQKERKKETQLYKKQQKEKQTTTETLPRIRQNHFKRMSVSLLLRKLRSRFYANEANTVRILLLRRTVRILLLRQIERILGERVTKPASERLSSKTV